MQTNRRHYTRQLILQALYQWILTEMPFNKLLEQFVEEFENVDIAYFKEVLDYILNNRSNLEIEYRKYVDRKSQSLDPIIESILLIGSYELIIRKELPYKVVINEALELTKEFGSQDSHKFVNGVLDKLAQEKRADESKK